MRKGAANCEPFRYYLRLTGMRSVAAVILSCLMSFPVHASSTEFTYSVYHGLFTDTTFGNILLKTQTDYLNSYITTASFAVPASYGLGPFKIEKEAQVVKHSGIQKHMEYNGVFVARYNTGPFSFGFGEGLSFATRNPDLENRRRTIFEPGLESEYSQNLLNYLLVEMAVDVPVDAYSPQAFIRLHHRSGIYGLMCPRTCGSNYIAYGVRFRAD